VVPVPYNFQYFAQNIEHFLAKRYSLALHFVEMDTDPDPQHGLQPIMYDTVPATVVKQEVFSSIIHPLWKVLQLNLRRRKNIKRR
jgi:hypothetical protein